MLQLMREGCSYTYPPLSIARYSFIQLSELEQCRVKTLPKALTPQHRIRNRVLLIESPKLYPCALQNRASAAILFLCYFPIFIHDPVFNDSNNSCSFPYGRKQISVVFTTEISAGSFTHFHPTQTHREPPNCYADK